MAYDNKPHAELALQFINGNRQDVKNAIRNEYESYDFANAIRLALDTYIELKQRSYSEEADQYAQMLRTWDIEHDYPSPHYPLPDAL